MTSAVFLIPNILSEILEQLDYDEREPHWLPMGRRRLCQRTLVRACLLVNRLWFVEASRIVWREGASLHYFARMHDVERRRHYEKLVRKLTIIGLFEACGRFKFSGLEAVYMLQVHQRSLKEVLSLLMPTLKHVMIIPASIESVEKLQQNCPLIESLYLHFEEMASEDLAKIKRYYATAGALRVELPGRHTESILPVLAQNEHLRELTNLSIDNECIRLVREAGAKQPFKNLSVLLCKIDCAVAVRDLLGIMPCLEYIVLDRSCYHQPVHIHENLNDVLMLASTKLKRISMRAGETHVEKSQLLALATKFPLLESVQLHSLAPDSSAHDSSENLDNEFAYTFTSRLPNLKVIELEFHESLTAEGLISIGKNCPLLEVLDMVGGTGRRVTWRKRVLFNYPRFSIEREPLFSRLIFLAPVEPLKHLPRSMQRYHFPRIVEQQERTSSTIPKGVLRSYWKDQRLFSM